MSLELSLNLQFDLPGDMYNKLNISKVHLINTNLY